jgi:hypothetical protein
VRCDATSKSVGGDAANKDITDNDGAIYDDAVSALGDKKAGASMAMGAGNTRYSNDTTCGDNGGRVITTTDASMSGIARAKAI